jgi:hypothetical protein
MLGWKPMWLTCGPYKKRKFRYRQIEGEGKDRMKTGTRQLSSRQGERPQRKPNLPTSWSWIYISAKRYISLCSCREQCRMTLCLATLASKMGKGEIGEVGEKEMKRGKKGREEKKQKINWRKRETSSGSRGLPAWSWSRRLVGAGVGGKAGDMPAWLLPTLGTRAFRENKTLPGNSGFCSGVCHTTAPKNISLLCFSWAHGLLCGPSWIDRRQRLPIQPRAGSREEFSRKESRREPDLGAIKKKKSQNTHTYKH